MENVKQLNIFQQIFRNEIAQVVSICVVLWQIVVQIVLPLQKVQLEVEQINVSIAQLQSDTRITQNTNDIIQLKDEMRQVFQVLKLGNVK